MLNEKEVYLLKKNKPELLNSPFFIEKRKRINENYTMQNIHYHNSYEIYYLVDGERDYFIRDRTYRVKKGDMILINKHDIHRTIYAGSYKHERILIKLKEEYLDNIIKEDKSNSDLFRCIHENDVIRLDINQQIFIENILDKMLSEYKEQDKNSNLYIKVLLTELCITLDRYAENAEGLEHHNLIHEKVSEIVRYINDNYTDEISVDILTKKFSISSSYLSTIFKELTGFTMINYINSVRIKEAQRLLRNTDLYITKISEVIGFNSLTHFGRVFKQLTKYSPSEYRKLKKL